MNNAKRLKEECKAIQQRNADLGDEVQLLKRQNQAQRDMLDDCLMLIDMVRKSLGVSEEPHQGMPERIIEAVTRCRAERDELAASVERLCDFMVDQADLFDDLVNRGAVGSHPQVELDAVIDGWRTIAKREAQSIRQAQEGGGC